jgi:hypothetical protein
VHYSIKSFQIGDREVADVLAEFWNVCRRLSEVATCEQVSIQPVDFVPRGTQHRHR